MVEQYPESIRLDESGYGSGQHSLIVLSGENKREIRAAVKDRNYRVHNGDRPGQVFAYSCKILRWLRGDHQLQAVCVHTSHWDV